MMFRCETEDLNMKSRIVHFPQQITPSVTFKQLFVLFSSLFPKEKITRRAHDELHALMAAAVSGKPAAATDLISLKQ